MSEVTLTSSGPPETVIADEPADVRSAVAAAMARGDADRRAAIAEVVAGGAAVARGVGPARRRRAGRDRGLRGLPGRLPPGPRHVAGQRLAGERVRALGAPRQPGVPPGPRRAAAHGRRDPRGRRSRALRPLPSTARPGVATCRPAAERAAGPVHRCGAVRRGQPPHGGGQGAPGRRRRADGRPGGGGAASQRAPSRSTRWAATPGRSARSGWRWSPDDHPGEGPFPATLTALRHARRRGRRRAVLRSAAPERPGRQPPVWALGAAGPTVLGAVPVVDGHRPVDPRRVATGGPRARWRRPTPAGRARFVGCAAGLALCEVTDIDPARWPTPTPGPTCRPPPPELRSARVASRRWRSPRSTWRSSPTRRAEGAPLIDVREDAEFAEAHVPGRSYIPLGQVAERIDEVPTDQTVYVICARGARSAKAVEHYRAQGIDAVNVAGGMLGLDRRRASHRLGGPRGRGRVSASTGADTGTHAWIDTDGGFADLVAELATAEAYGLDTEFHRERTYHARLALLQLSWPGGRGRRRPDRWSTWRRSRPCWPGPGCASCTPPARTSRSSCACAARFPSRLFDTQVAAGFVGYSSVGLAGLVQGELGRQAPQGRSPHRLAGPPAARGRRHLRRRRRRAPPRAARPHRRQARGARPPRLGARRVRGAPHPHHERPGAGSGLVADQGGALAAGPRRGRRPGAGGVARAQGGGDRSTGAVPARRPGPRGDGPAPAGHRGRPPARAGPRRRASARAAPAASSSPVVAEGVALPLEEVQVPPSEGVDRSRRAAASLVSAWAAQRARDLDIDADDPRHPRRHRVPAHGRRRPAGHRLATRRGGRADPGAGRRGGLARCRSSGTAAARDPLRGAAHRRMTAVSAGRRPEKGAPSPAPSLATSTTPPTSTTAASAAHVHEHRPRVAVGRGPTPRQHARAVRRAPPGRRAASAGLCPASLQQPPVEVQDRAPGRPAAPPRSARPVPAGRAATGVGPQPCGGAAVHGSGARQPSRPPGSTTRSAGTSASSRPELLAGVDEGRAPLGEEDHGGGPGPGLAPTEAGAVPGDVVVREDPGGPGAAWAEERLDPVEPATPHRGVPRRVGGPEVEGEVQLVAVAVVGRDPLRARAGPSRR